MPTSPFPPAQLDASGPQSYPPSYPPGPPGFPAWPPPSGGAPVTQSEMGPVLNPYPYGSTQGSNISTAPPAPPPLATFFPDDMPPNNGQNQGPGYPGLPAWPWPAKMTTLPDKAPPSLSQIP